MKTILGPFWDYLGQFWEHFRAILVSFWKRLVAIILHTFGVQVGLTSSAAVLQCAAAPRT